MGSAKQSWREWVLYVGDSTNNRDAIDGVFHKHGHQLVSACCYREALSWINRNRFALVFCEERLRDGWWFDLLSRFADMNEPPALILLAETQDAANWAEAISLGARDVLVTPISDSELQHATDHLAVPV
jgi:DNA-binding NtrC family response regulator